MFWFVRNNCILLHHLGLFHGHGWFGRVDKTKEIRTAMRVRNNSHKIHSKFIPVFALQMDDVDLPVVYGLTTGGNNRTFSLSRCGTPLRMDGTYDEAKPPFISTVLDGIGMVPCTKQEQNAEGKCLSKIPDSTNATGFKAASAVTAEDMLDLLYQQSDYGYDIQSADNRSPSRHFLEPACRLETDSF